jgi:hypothetical protein
MASAQDLGTLTVGGALPVCALQAAMQALGFREWQSVAVHHCQEAYGLVLQHASGWKLVYSGGPAGAGVPSSAQRAAPAASRRRPGPGSPRRCTPPPRSG